MESVQDLFNLDPCGRRYLLPRAIDVSAGTPSRPTSARHARSPNDNPARRVADKTSPAV